MKAPINYTFDAPITTVEELKLKLRDWRFSVFYHRTKRNADGTPMRWRVSGQLKTWKRDPNRFRLPVKHGMYDNDAIESFADLAMLATAYEVACD